MVFEGLAEKLQNAFKKLKNKGKLTEKDVIDAMREVRLALLEADVNFKVVKDFVNRLRERAIGSEVLESLTPAQQVIKIVNEVTNYGCVQSKINFASKPLRLYARRSARIGQNNNCGYRNVKTGEKALTDSGDI